MDLPAAFFSPKGWVNVSSVSMRGVFVWAKVRAAVPPWISLGSNRPMTIWNGRVSGLEYVSCALKFGYR
ncbi:MAG: hypothetical protein ACJ787_21200 [Myxococcales bacterium]